MFRPVHLLLLMTAWVAAVMLLPGALWACPFCAAVSQTFSEEIGTSDVVAIARLATAPVIPAAGEAIRVDEVAKSKFELTRVIKGAEHLSGASSVEILYFGEAKKGTPFLLMGVKPPRISWTTPTPLSPRARDYILRLPKLPKKGAGRLAFFQQHLEDEDEMLARDAYDEFAKAPYPEVIDLRERMEHDKLVAWIQSNDVPANRKRLYLTMLGVCGDEKDAQMLAERLRSSDRKKKAGLDAMIASYLTLRGAKGLPLIEELFLKNKKAEYADTYAAIMALRFHGTETEVIPRKRIVQAMHHMLDRPALADLVIVDLARWEDWSVLPRLLELYRKADEKSSWVRVPVVRFVMACPSPEAKAALAELEKIDAGAVKRAQTFFPFGGGAPAGGSGKQQQKQDQKAPAPNTSTKRKRVNLWKPKRVNS